MKTTETIMISSAAVTPITSNNRILDTLTDKNRNNNNNNSHQISAYLTEGFNKMVQFRNEKADLYDTSSNQLKSNKNHICSNRKVYKKDTSTSSQINTSPSPTNEKLLSIQIANANIGNNAVVNNNNRSIFCRSDSDSPTIANLIKINIDSDPDYDQITANANSISLNKTCSLNLEDGLMGNESFSSSDYVRAHDIEINKQIVRNKPNLKVQDLALKLPKLLEKKIMNYPRLIIAIATFYVLPVIQLILLYQTQLNKSGNEDSCYFNFLCMIKNGPFAAFNNVFSNVGYVLLGIMFIIVVKKACIFCYDLIYSIQS